MPIFIGAPVLVEQVQPLMTSHVIRVYEYLLRHGLYPTANHLTHMNEDTAKGVLKARRVSADIGGGFIGDDGVMYLQDSYKHNGVEYRMDEIFYHELLARLGLPHGLNEQLTLRFRKNESIPDFVLKNFARNVKFVMVAH